MRSVLEQYETLKNQIVAKRGCCPDYTELPLEYLDANRVARAPKCNDRRRRFFARFPMIEMRSYVSQTFVRVCCNGASSPQAVVDQVQNRVRKSASPTAALLALAILGFPDEAEDFAVWALERAKEY